MRRHQFLILRLVLVLATGAAMVLSALPVARHMAGIVVLELPPRNVAPAEAPPENLDLTALFAFAPFGRAAQPESADPGQQADLPDMKLRGIIASSKGASVAILQIAEVTDFFRAGEKIMDRLEVSLIHQDFVELLDGERKITLHFDENAMEAEMAGATPAIQKEAPSLFDRISGGLVVPARYEKPGPPETTAEYIDYWRGRIRKNPQAVLAEIGLEPTEGGYVIAQQHDVGVRLAGLRSGDLVRSVNGQPVGNPDDDRRFFDRIAASGQARIEVERGGKVLTMSFPLR